MQHFNYTLAALLVVSNVTMAEPASDSAIYEPAVERILLAQASTTTPTAEAQRESGRRESRREPSEQESLALAALEGLMAQPSERALPIVKRVLSGPQSTLVKQRALFVLSQMDGAEAQTLLVQTARSADPALRGEAIRNIGIGGNPKSLGVLQEIYTAGDPDVKQRVLEAWLISNSRDQVFQAALNAKSDIEANDAIRMLGAMGAGDELRKLGDMRKPGHNLVEAYAISGDLVSLRKIVTSDADLDTRSDAVRKIGIIDSDAARSALREIYSGASAEELKSAALEGMLISGDEQGVLALYRGSKSADEKRALLRTLSHMDGDAALEAIDAALEPKP
ncbi:MAG TPA: HEAT repeat domain-containing protein [Steroidobacteraceae bacterium]|nr:HEAT repeat domain-containing protein [Steroidobacteraceae bacterium]